jgi:hypothetical protein
MRALGNLIANTNLWISVAVGILCSVLAAYLKPALDSGLGRMSKAWAEKTATRRQARLSRVQHYADDVFFFVHGVSDASDARSRAIMYFLATILFTVAAPLGRSVIPIVVTTGWVLAIRELLATVRIRSEINEAVDLRISRRSN